MCDLTSDIKGHEIHHIACDMTVFTRDIVLVGGSGLDCEHVMMVEVTTHLK